MDEIRTYTDFLRYTSSKEKLRRFSRSLAVTARSVSHSVANTTDWIRMIYYHHVFDDEIKGFRRQLNYLRKFGEFISLDQLVDMVSGNEPLNGRYFCISFDDGFYNLHTNMLEITDALEVPIIIYLPTDYIDEASRKEEASGKEEGGGLPNLSHPEHPRKLRHMDWEMCRDMLSHGITFGSHTTSHTILSTLSNEQLENELATSKQIIEERLGVVCDHFCPPNGKIPRDFDPVITEEIALKVGYKTVVSTHRGVIRQGDNPYRLNREHLVAAWGNRQIKYFFGKS
jgi:peptidoglycan/xylan/chitin deacetylase (PgdA/CDA1 family)